MNSSMKSVPIQLVRDSSACWRVLFDNPPLNLMGAEFVLRFREIMAALESDDDVKVVIFQSAVEGYFLDHSDFLASLDDLTQIPQAPRALRRGRISSCD